MIGPVQYEQALKVLRSSEESKRFLPFYRNTLLPVLNEAVLRLLSETDSERELLVLSQYAKCIKDLEGIMNGVIVRGEDAKKVIEKTLRKIVTAGSEA